MLIIIPGPPVPKMRPRFSVIGGRIRTYNAQAKRERETKTFLRAQREKTNTISTAIYLCLAFGMPIPRSATAAQKEAMHSGKIRHTKKPDLDNLIKYICDCANGVLWRDDAQIVTISADKIYAAEPYTMLLVEKAPRRIQNQRGATDKKENEENMESCQA